MYRCLNNHNLRRGIFLDVQKTRELLSRQSDDRLMRFWRPVIMTSELTVPVSGGVFSGDIDFRQA